MRAGKVKKTTREKICESGGFMIVSLISVVDRRRGRLVMLRRRIKRKTRNIGDCSHC
ncbi:hypothetical protein HanPI659440_Chr03g0111471 [Helianthus annuus]|nr:hypothetical protein HanPI659440_Chr03g0111471 [Helianthus annuus]